MLLKLAPRITAFLGGPTHNTPMYVCRLSFIQPSFIKRLDYAYFLCFFHCYYECVLEYLKSCRFM